MSYVELKSLSIYLSCWDGWPHEWESHHIVGKWHCREDHIVHDRENHVVRWVTWSGEQPHCQRATWSGTTWETHMVRRATWSGITWLGEPHGQESHMVRKKATVSGSHMVGRATTLLHGWESHHTVGRATCLEEPHGNGSIKLFNKFIIVPLFLPDHDLWDKYKPQPIDIKSANIHDYYDICEELGTWVVGDCSEICDKLLNEGKKFGIDLDHRMCFIL